MEDRKSSGSMSNDHVESGQPIMEGYLEKERPHGIHSWQSRFFRLYPKTLQYWKNEKLKDERGIIDLGTVRAIDEEYVDDSIFEIKTNAKIKDTDNRSYRLKAPSIPLRTLWVKTLADTIYKLMSENQKKEGSETSKENRPPSSPESAKFSDDGNHDNSNHNQRADGEKSEKSSSENNRGGVTGVSGSSGGSSGSSSGGSSITSDKTFHDKEVEKSESTNNDDRKPKKLVFTPIKPAPPATPKVERTICQRACSTESCIIS